MNEEKDKYHVYRHLSLATQLGSTLLVSLLLGILIGFYIDKYFSTSPIFMIGMGFFGIYSGLKTVVSMCSENIDNESKESKEKN